MLNIGSTINNCITHRNNKKHNQTHKKLFKKHFQLYDCTKHHIAAPPETLTNVNNCEKKMKEREKREEKTDTAKMSYVLPICQSVFNYRYNLRYSR
ncbi:hypothetical protein DSECCO2_268930 [anaerobic digester metagenome]